MSEDQPKKVRAEAKVKAQARSSKSKKVAKNSTLLTVLLVLALALAGYFYVQYQDIRNNPADAIASRNQEDSQRVLAKLGDVILLGEEEPTVARIEDPTELQQSNPDFYENAQAGDFLVLYPSRAIVFREVTNKIINVAPIINTDNINTDASLDNNN